jgi:hypothetical protein
MVERPTMGSKLYPSTLNTLKSFMYFSWLIRLRMSQREQQPREKNPYINPK